MKTATWETVEIMYSKCQKFHSGARFSGNDIN